MTTISDHFSQTPFFSSSIEEKYHRLSRILSQYLDTDSPIFNSWRIDRSFLSQNTVSWIEYQQHQSASPMVFPYNLVKKVEHLPVMLTDQDLRTLTECFPNLEELDLPGCLTLTHKGIRALQIVKMKKLVLACLEIKDRAMTYLAGMEFLEDLSILECINLTEKGYEAIFSCGKLRRLEVLRASLSQTQIDWFMQHAGLGYAGEGPRNRYTFTLDNLSIDADERMIFADELDREVEARCERNRVVKDIYLNQCQLSVGTFTAIGRKKLQSLALIGSPTPERFSFPAEFSSRLRSLTITNLRDAKTTYQTFVDCIRLKELKVMNCRCETTQWLKDLIGCSIAIRKLDLCSVELSEEILEVIGRISSLERLTLADCSGLSDSSLHLLSNSRLKVLRIATDPFIDKQRFFKAIQNLALNELHLKGPTLVQQDIVNFDKLFKGLKVLCISHQERPDELETALPLTKINKIVSI